MCAFHIAPPRPRRFLAPIAAFDGADDEDAEQQQQQEAAAAAAAAGGASGGSSSSEAVAQLIEQGSSCAAAGDAAAALKYWDRALLTQPDNADVHEMRAQVLNAAADRTFEALQAAQQAVSLRPDWADAHITLARVRLNFGEPGLALRSYQAAAKLQPKHPALAEELPSAQMFAKLQEQQAPGSRMAVLDRPPTRQEQEQRAQDEADAAVGAVAPGGGEDDEDDDDAVARQLLGVLRPHATGGVATVMEVDE